MSAPHPGHPGAGARVFIVLTAFCFGSGAILAKLAYLGGSNALSVMTARTLAALVWLLVLLRLSGTRLTLPAPLRKRALALGCLMCVNTFGLYNAIEHMPAPLAMLNFYIYPMIVTLVEVLSGRESLQPRKAFALVLAFSGLMLALNTGSLRPTAAGIASATIGALAFTAILVLSARLFPPGDSRPRTAHMMASAALVFVAASLGSGSFTLPHGTLGMVGFVGVCISFPLSVTGLFMSVGRIGAGQVALYMNVEPLTVIGLSALVLGQTLSGLQSTGAAMVLAALLLMQWPARPLRKAA
jgi:drug/metabolite transporter (DMT)-like permease